MSSQKNSSETKSELTNEAKVAAVQRYVEAFQQADLDIIRDIYANDAVVEDPVGSAPMKGIDAICEFYRAAFDGGVKIRLTGDVRSAGNSCAFSFEVDAGGGMVISPIDVFEFNKEGKVVLMKAYWGPENMKA
jgi:steroid delta-isomerase